MEKKEWHDALGFARTSSKESSLDVQTPLEAETASVGKYG